MTNLVRPILVVFASLTLVTGVAYPALVTAIARIAFPARSSGSLVMHGDQAVGSALVGRPFAGPGWFHGRPSATPNGPYDALASSGSNLGPTNPALAKLVGERVAEEGGGPVPIDLVTASASGLDPHLSPAAARFQLARVARERGLAEARVAALVDAATEDRTLGLLGERRVNVLLLNLSLPAVGE